MSGKVEKKVMNNICTTLGFFTDEHIADRKKMIIKASVETKLVNNKMPITFKLIEDKRMISIYVPIQISLKNCDPVDIAILAAVKNNKNDRFRLVYDAKKNSIWFDMMIPYIDSVPHSYVIETAIYFLAEGYRDVYLTIRQINGGKFTITDFLEKEFM